MRPRIGIEPGSSGSVEPGTPHDMSAVGTAVHRVVARLLEQDERQPDRERLVAEAACEPAAALPHVYGIAARRRIIGATTVYFGLFVPGPEWRFVGAELPVLGAVLDLVFETGGITRADELKVGLAAADGQEPGLPNQIGAAVRGGRARFGPGFAGLRVILLAAPLRSFTCRSVCATTPIFPDGVA